MLYLPPHGRIFHCLNYTVLVLKELKVVVIFQVGNDASVFVFLRARVSVLYFIGVSVQVSFLRTNEGVRAEFEGTISLDTGEVS